MRGRPSELEDRSIQHRRLGGVPDVVLADDSMQQQASAKNYAPKQPSAGFLPHISLNPS